MAGLLTITIPSYNRGGMLNNQLSWLSREVRGFEQDCDIVVNDNCSLDNTQEIINNWKTKFREQGVMFTTTRHNRNIGGMANIVGSIASATGTYVWTLGDDDVIQDGTLSYIFGLLKKNGTLGLILLDGIGRNLNTGEVELECFFHSTSDEPLSDASKFEPYIENALAGILFISNAIYNTKLVHEALLSWPSSTKNLAAQAYWVAYCAAREPFIITPTKHTEATMGIGFTDSDKHWHFKIKFSCVPEVYVRLMDSGYSRSFCLNNILFNLKSFASWRVFIGGVRRWFTFSLITFAIYLRYVSLGVRLNQALNNLEKVKSKL